MAGEAVLPDKPRPLIPTREKGLLQAGKDENADRRMSSTQKLMSDIKTQYDSRDPHASLEKIRQIGETVSADIPTDEHAHGASASNVRDNYDKNNPRATLESFAAMAQEVPEPNESTHEDIDAEIISRFAEGKIKRKDPNWTVIESAILAQIIDVRPEFNSLKPKKRKALVKRWMSDSESRYVVADLLVGNLKPHEAVRHLRTIASAQDKMRHEANEKLRRELRPLMEPLIHQTIQAIENKLKAKRANREHGKAA